MMTAIIIFMVVATIFAIGSLVFVAADVIIDRRKKEEPVEQPVEEKEDMPPLVVVPVVVLDKVEDIAICRLNEADVVRHVIVQRIIKAYEEDENRRANRK